MSNHIHIYILPTGDVIASTESVRDIALICRQELLITSVGKGCIVDVLQDRYTVTSGQQYDIGDIKG